MFTLDVCENTFCGGLDYEVLASLKDRIQYNNTYFLVCLSEVIYREAQKAREQGVNIQLENDDVLDEMLDKAYAIYREADISSYFDAYFE